MVKGQFLNAFLPGRVGDLLRLKIYRDVLKEPNGTWVVLSKMGLDRLIDLSALLCVFMFVFRSISLLLDSKLDIAVFVAMVSILHLVLFLWLRTSQSQLALRVKRGVSAFWTNLKDLRLTEAIGAFVCSLASWVLEATAIMLLARAWLPEFNMHNALHSLLLLNLGLAVPVTVGGVGVYEASLMFALTQIGLSQPHALMVAVIHHFLQWGAVILWRLVVMLPYKRFP